MNPSDLRSRLDSIKKRNLPLPGESGKSSRDKRTGPDENKKNNPGRHSSETYETLPMSGKALLENGWEKVCEMVYKRTGIYENILPDKVPDFLVPEDTESSRLVFYDTETTGLSGGAGNIVFLAGFGFIKSGKFRIVQIMLSDFPGETSFLEEVGKYINSESIYVSYNGKTFDSNILKNRFAMNGMKIEFGLQLDLLYPARRIWKNIIGSCSLGDIEQKVLKKKRALDVPGALVPDLYFDFIREGKYSFIEGVAAHHLEDIKSLADMLSLFAVINRDPLKYGCADRAGLASLFLSFCPDVYVELLGKGMEEGCLFCARELGLYYKKTERYDAAADVWIRMWSDRKSILAGIELAKHYEHREKNIEKALSITEDLLSLERILIRDIKTELEKRKNRLLLKLKRML